MVRAKALFAWKIRTASFFSNLFLRDHRRMMLRIGFFALVNFRLVQLQGFWRNLLRLGSRRSRFGCPFGASLPTQNATRRIEKLTKLWRKQERPTLSSGRE